MSIIALARRVRRHAVEMTHAGNSSHLGSCLSCIDILAVLYGRVMTVDPAHPDWPERDRLVVSKGHASAAVYGVLAESGFFDPAELTTFYRDGSRLLGHVTRGAAPGIELSTGSLGHGLPVSVGMALAAARDGHSHRVFCLLSDGECDEGSNWEAVLLAAHHQLSNLVAIVDYNKIQSLATVADTLRLEPFADKWRAFGWAVTEVDGHDVTALAEAMAPHPARSAPLCVLAHTTKGKGISFMENTVLWHYRSPQADEYARAIAELDRGEA